MYSSAALVIECELYRYVHMYMENEFTHTEVPCSGDSNMDAIAVSVLILGVL